MRAVIQRVSFGSVTVEDEVVGSIGKGFVVLLSMQDDDTEAQIERLWTKIERLRIFEDAHGKTGADLAAVGGSVLIISQFTLHANCKKGNRPSFTGAAAPDKAEQLYNAFINRARESDIPVEAGVFGAYMLVDLQNDGPFTIILDTDELAGC